MTGHCVHCTMPDFQGQSWNKLTLPGNFIQCPITFGHVAKSTRQTNGVYVDEAFPVNIEDLLKYCPTCPPDAFINIKELYLNPILNKFDETDRNSTVGGTANKNNNFTWADGAGKRLVIWNEPNYEQAHIEKMKELLGAGR
ncbi:NS2 [Aphis craccivora]|uniref:NS2 n=1 Tax=Aphis craccivora TaxID=307492 RepID=A0A6G0VUX5_APHCR|nr:NS2 [Aphis craccivora]